MLLILMIICHGFLLSDLSRTPNPPLIKVLDDCLAEHEDLCTRKKVIPNEFLFLKVELISCLH